MDIPGTVTSLLDWTRAFSAGALAITGAVFVTFALHKFPPFPRGRWLWVRYPLFVAEVSLPPAAMVAAAIGVTRGLNVAATNVLPNIQDVESQLGPLFDDVSGMASAVRLAVSLTLAHFLVRYVRLAIEEAMPVANDLMIKTKVVLPPPPRRPVGPRIAGHRRRRDR